MSFRIASCLAFCVALVVACVGPGSAPNQCESLGGACKTSTSQCGEFLPYTCNVGICCIPGPNSGPGPSATASGTSTSPAPGLDSSAPQSQGDSATAADTSVDTTVPNTQDSGATADSTMTQVDSSTDAAMPDQAAADTLVPDTQVADTNLPDTHVPDTSAPDTSAADTSADQCGGYASPTMTGPCSACSGHNCQPNGCFNGYWCDTTLIQCVPQTLVFCDSGF
jgi:hypothetical protein